MGTNAKLVPQSTPEEDERLLEDTVFPFTYCDLDAAPGAQLPDIETDAVALDQGERKEVVGNVKRCEELISWLQAIGTPCGYYLFQCQLAQSKLLQSACLRLVNLDQGLELSLPLMPWVRTNLQVWTAKIKAGDPMGEAYEVLIKAIRTWLSLDKGVGTISGEVETSIRIARNHLALLDRWIGGTEDLAVSIPEGASPEDPACPFEAGLPLGSRAITRSSGKVGGYLYLMMLEEAARELGLDFNGTPYYQGSAFELPTLALFDKTLIGRRPESEASLLTFLAASDLAMFTPLHPRFASLRTGLRWDSLHPGSRLKQILAVIDDKKLSLESRDAKDYFSFTSAICQALSWPEVHRFLDAGRGIDPSGPNRPVSELFIAACEAREVKPAAFLDPTMAVQELTALMPLCTQLAEVESSSETDKALALALEAELFALGFQLLYSNAAPAFVCAPFKEALSKVGKPTDLLKEYFGIEL